MEQETITCAGKKCEREATHLLICFEIRDGRMPDGSLGSAPFPDEASPLCPACLESDISGMEYSDVRLADGSEACVLLPALLKRGWESLAERAKELTGRYDYVWLAEMPSDATPLSYGVEQCPCRWDVRELDVRLRTAIESHWDDLDSGDFLYCDTLAYVYADSVGHLGYHTWLQYNEEQVRSL